MYNTENLRFIQIHAVAVRVEHPALSLPDFSYLCTAVSALSRSLQCCSLSSLSCNGFGALLEVFRVSMLTINSKTTLNWGINNCLGLHVFLDHAHIVHTRRRAHVCNGHMYDIYIYQKNSAVQLTSVGLTRACLNYKAEHFGASNTECCYSYYTHDA